MGHVVSSSSTRKHPRVAVPIGGTAGVAGSYGATADMAMQFDGELLTRWVYELYQSNNGLTRTLSIIDENGVTVYTGPAHTDNTKSSYAPTGGVELDGTYTVRLLQSAGGATAGIDYLTLFVR
jgi:hypothetical protein